MPDILNTDLHDRAMRFIDIVNAFHVAGQGSFPVADLIRLFGIELDHNQLLDIEQRGDLEMAATDSTCGTFANVGRRAEFRQGIATVITPSTVSGLYLCDPDHCYFRFDPANTIVGAAFMLFSSKLKSIYVDRSRIKIKMDDRVLDQNIKHRPSQLVNM